LEYTIIITKVLKARREVKELEKREVKELAGQVAQWQKLLPACLYEESRETCRPGAQERGVPVL